MCIRDRDTGANDAPLLTTTTSSVNTSTPTITGTARPDAAVTLYINGSATGTITDADATSGIFSITVPSQVDATYAISVAAPDQNGDPSISGAINITIDTAAPDAPVITTTTDLTNDNTPEIAGTAEAETTVTLFNGSTSLGTDTADADGNFSITPSLELPDNSYTLTVTATDALGNESAASNELAITIDATAPSTPSISTTTDLTNDSTPVIQGTAEAGSTVTLFSGDTSLGPATAGSDGSFSITSSELADNDYTLTVKATDAAGNTSSASTALALTIDTAAPDAPVITTTTDLTNDNTPEIAGTAEAETTVTLFNGSTSLGTDTADADGNFSITPSLELPDNSYTLTVTATDALGNESAASNELAITIDATAPSTPSISTTTSLTNDNTPVIEGTAEAGSTVNLYNETQSATYVVTVESKTSEHTYDGTGSSLGYKIDGVFSPFLTFTPGNTYRFDQSDASNANHPLRFYLDAERSTLYDTDVITNGTPGQAGAYTEITISDTTPSELHLSLIHISEPTRPY